MTDPRQFWENKIIDWERGRYDAIEDAPQLLERWANRASSSLRFRVAWAAELIGAVCQGKRVLDLGCGTGRLAQPLLASGARSYVGYDIAENAINAANQNAARLGISETALFIRAGVDALPNRQEFDVVCSLGLLDWLSLEDIGKIHANTAGAVFLHAFSERRRSFWQLMHRLYVHASYGHRTGGYVPHYFSAADMLDCAAAHTPAPARIMRHRKLSFGAFVTNIPEDNL